MHINFFRNFHSNAYTLTIYFIALNEFVGFVLIYRPHPVVTVLIQAFVQVPKVRRRITLPAVKTVLLRYED